MNILSKDRKQGFLNLSPRPGGDAVPRFRATRGVYREESMCEWRRRQADVLAAIWPVQRVAFTAGEPSEALISTSHLLHYEKELVPSPPGRSITEKFPHVRLRHPQEGKM